MEAAQLPYVDEHAMTVAAGVDEVWSSLLDALDRAFSRPGAGTYARIVGCVPRSASGPRPLAEGSTVPGFRVADVVPRQRLVLEGRHRFSTYALAFHLEAQGDGRSRLRAETRADFPGPAGRAYRLLVIRTGAHVRGVRSLLASARRRAERHDRSPT